MQSLDVETYRSPTKHAYSHALIGLRLLALVGFKDQPEPDCLPVGLLGYPNDPPAIGSWQMKMQLMTCQRPLAP